MADQRSRGGQKQRKRKETQGKRHAHVGEQPNRAERKKAEDARRGQKGRG
jgi:hypothetical protein